MPLSANALLAAALLSLPLRTGAAAPPVPPAAAPALFAFHSNFWLNLHHFLYVTARARRGLDGRRPGVAAALADTAGVGALPAADRDVWERAIAYYDSTIAQRDVLFDSGMVAINDRLTHTDSASSLRGSGIDPALAGALESAAPVYRRLWWPRHDAANRSWQATLEPLVAQHGDSIAAWESRAFRTPWASTPVRVDVTAYSNWAGAYTTTNPAHITIASLAPNNQGDQALEIIFHEVLHTMDDSLASALARQFSAQAKAPPPDFTHAFIFYTAGAFTRRAIPAHVPYGEKYGLWSRSPSFARALPALRESWQRYLDGDIGFEEAIRRYVAESPSS